MSFMSSLVFELYEYIWYYNTTYESYVNTNRIQWVMTFKNYYIIIFYTISDFAASLTIVNIYSLKLLGEGHKVETNMNI